MFRQDLTGPVKLIQANVEIDIGRASADEVERAGSLIPDSRRSEVFRWRLQNGCMCFVARAGSTLVACNWVRLFPGVDDGDMIALGEGEAYHFDIYVDENWRGSRVGGALSSHIRLFEQQRGCMAIYTRISVFNRKSLKAARFIGWKPTGLILRVRGSKSGGWPILTLWGSAHPLERLRRNQEAFG
jgi:GNAT superfamily N-acetyltransferase